MAEIVIVHRFDVEEGRWLSITPMSRARGNLAVSELGGAFFCVGGGTPTTQYDLAERCVFVPLSLPEAPQADMKTVRNDYNDATCRGKPS